jgi:hypothetical protein
MRRRIASRFRPARARGSAPPFALAAENPFAVRDNPEKLASERQLFTWLVDAGGFYVQQSGGEAVVAYAQREFARVPLSTFYSIRNVLAPDLDLQTFSDFMSANQRVFWSIDAWKEELRNVSLCVGPRLHGNMVAIGAGVPAVFVPHDSRTSELVDAMRMPHVTHDDVQSSASVRELVARAAFDGDAFDANRTQIAQVYKRRLEDLGIHADQRLHDLAQV